ncbi:MAG: hypothetical protein M3252_08665 [Actinomycetota bacterium]|nr:hypothetical protein [Actinomycetota bacterium]
MQSRYSRWDGTQEPFGARVDVGKVLDEIGDDLLRGAGGDASLRRLLRRGLSGQTRGLDDLRRRLQAARERLSEQLDLEGPLADVRQRLDEIVALERAALTARDDDEARFAEFRLDALPADPGGMIRELQEYAFASPEAAGKFTELVEELRRQVLDAYFRDLGGALRSVTAEDLAKITEMLADLNRMLAARENGTEPDFDAFMAQHGQFFPENPQNLDELMQVLARRMAAMSRLLASLTPEQRRELNELARSVFDDLDLAFELAQLQDHLRGLLPSLPWDETVQGGWSDEPLPLSAAVEAVERLSDLDELEREVEGNYPGANLEDVDEEALRRELGEDAVTDLRQLKAIERALEEAGVLQRRHGRLELTPRGARMLGERALTKLLDRIRRETATRTGGLDAEPTGQTRPWTFGEKEPIAVERTVFNSVARSITSGSGAPTFSQGGSLRLRPDDFEVLEQEVRPRTATALLLDLSFSMPLRGHFVPAKRMALALYALIQGKYPQDSLYLVGFSDYARRMQPADLGAAGFERVYGTNMQHAFLLARRLLVDDPRSTKQVIMVTDGEPTAHLDGDVAYFNWPPIRETITKTLREAVRLARSGISINVFLLEDDPGLVAFADRLARVANGQVFQVAGDELGRFIVRDYVRTRGGR